MKLFAWLFFQGKKSSNSDLVSRSFYFINIFFFKSKGRRFYWIFTSCEVAVKAWIGIKMIFERTISKDFEPKDKEKESARMSVEWQALQYFLFLSFHRQINNKRMERGKKECQLLPAFMYHQHVSIICLLHLTSFLSLRIHRFLSNRIDSQCVVALFRAYFFYRCCCFHWQNRLK